MSLVNMIMRKVISRLIKVKKMITRKFRLEEIIINGAFLFFFGLFDRQWDSSNGGKKGGNVCGLL